MKKGFTLAEVLVTLGIIGVVSAMTVPSLMQNHQRKAYVGQLHKFYNELSQALLQYQTDRNAINQSEAGLTTIAAYGEFQKKYFKIVQDCGTGGTPCFAASYKKMSGVRCSFACRHNCMVLASGTAMGIAGIGSNNVVEVVLDINGAKGPNIFGRDAFTLYIYPNGVIDDLTVKNVDDPSDSSWGDNTAPLSEEQRERNFQRACSGSNGEWHGCFGKILNDGWEMNY